MDGESTPRNLTDYTPAQLSERGQEHLNRYISLADRKASALLTGQLAFLGLGASATTGLFTESGALFVASTVAAAICGLLGLGLSIVVIFPRTSKPSNGHLFWKDILEFENSDEFIKSFTNLKNHEAVEEVVAVNYELAKVAESKYDRLRWSLIATFGMLFFASIAGIFLVA